MGIPVFYLVYLSINYLNTINVLNSTGLIINTKTNFISVVSSLLNEPSRLVDLKNSCYYKAVKFQNENKTNILMKKIDRLIQES